MKIVFVTGPAYSGKSIYTAREYPEASVIDMRTFEYMMEAAESNEELEEIAENSMKYCREALLHMIRNGGEDETIVLKHPMLMKQTREFYLEAIKEITDCPVECAVMLPDLEQMKELTGNETSLLNLYEYERNILEMPDVSEGFASVEAVHSIL